MELTVGARVHVFAITHNSHVEFDGTVTYNDPQSATIMVQPDGWKKSFEYYKHELTAIYTGIEAY